jgi:uncharacterized protein (DUF2267 family)
MSTGLDIFDTSIEKTNELLKDIEVDLGWEGRKHQAYVAMKSVLHALRDRLQVIEAANLSAQLPLVLKGIFFEGWKPESVPIKMNREEFIQRIKDEIFYDYHGSTEDLIKVIIADIFKRLDPLEAEKIKNTLPQDLGDLLFGQLEDIIL